MMNVWTNEKNLLSIDTTKGISMIKSKLQAALQWILKSDAYE